MLIFIDCETTGLSGDDRIIQLAFIKTSNQLEVIKAQNYFFTVEKMSEEAREVHGFSIEELNHLSKGHHFLSQAWNIYCDLMHPGYHYWLVSHNTNFDYNLLVKELSRAGYSFQAPSLFCTMQNTAYLCGIPRNGDYKWPSIAELQYFMGVKHIKSQVRSLWGDKLNVHDARFDVTLLLEIFKTAVTREIFCLENSEWRVYLTPERKKEEVEIRKHNEEMRQLEKEEKDRKAKYTPGPAKNIISAKQVRETGLPYYKRWDEVPGGRVSKTRAKKMGQKIEPGEEPVGYVLCRLHKGYIPLYLRQP